LRLSALAEAPLAEAPLRLRTSGISRYLERE
jgi:hypothetical protein